MLYLCSYEFHSSNMSLELLPNSIIQNYEVIEWKHASAILYQDFPEEWKDIIDLLSQFRLKKSWILVGGENKSKVSKAIDSFLYTKGWREKEFDTSVMVDEALMESPTHKVDCYKNRIALEIEWNNKDPFFDRDLNNFRLLFDLRAISVGIIITRCDHLQKIFNEIGRGKSYGNSTLNYSQTQI